MSDTMAATLSLLERIGALRPGGPIVDRLQALADSLGRHLDANQLLVGVAGEEGRGVVELIARLRPRVEGVTLEEVRLGDAGARPSLDAWLLLLDAEQLGSLREREFLQAPAPANVLLLVTHIDRVPTERRAEVLAYARTQFRELGVDDTQVVPIAEGDEGLHSIAIILEAWRSRWPSMRREAIVTQVVTIRRDVAQAIDEARRRLGGFVDAAMAREAAADFTRAVDAAADAVEAASLEIATRLSREVLADWEAWLERAAAESTDEATLSAKLAERVKVDVSARLELELRTLLVDLGTKLPLIERPLHQVEIAPQISWTLPALPPPGPPEPAGRALRMLTLEMAIPVAAGLAGYLARGLLYALIGAAMGVGISVGLRTALRGRTKRDARIEGWTRPEMKDAIGAQLSGLLKEGVVQVARDLRRETEFERRRLERLALDAGAESTNREAVSSRLEELESLQSAMASLAGA